MKCQNKMLMFAEIIFDEVALGYTEELALAEANRCLHCKVPHCRKGCPVDIDIPAFIAKIKKRRF